MYDFIEAFILSVLPARLDSTQSRAQSQARLSYAEAQGEWAKPTCDRPIRSGMP